MFTDFCENISIILILEISASKYIMLNPQSNH